MIRRTWTRAVLTTAAWALPTFAFAEGSTELGDQDLLMGTVLYVDVLDPGEQIQYVGTGNLSIRTLGGVLLATLATGQEYMPPATGTYELTFSADQTGVWDVRVTGTAMGFGRLWSDLWLFDAGGFDESASSNASFYALVADGGEVLEVALDGYAGGSYQVYGNSAGEPGTHGRSIALPPNFMVSVEHPIYLNPPEAATWSHVSPLQTGAGFSGGPTACTNIIADGDGMFSVTSNVSGTIHVICDLDGNAT